MPKALVYALGGGRGHATRCGVLAGWFPADWEVHTILPARLAEQFPGAFHHYVTPTELRSQILSLLAQVQPDLLLVDTFPRGLLGELVSLVFGVCRSSRGDAGTATLSESAAVRTHPLGEGPGLGTCGRTARFPRAYW